MTTEKAVTEWLEELGGVARRGSLLRLVPRGDLERAVRVGDVVRDSRGLYSLPGVDVSVRTAAVLGGVLSFTSAALAHGWAVAIIPDKPHVTVNRGRRVGAGAARATVHVADLSPDDVAGGPNGGVTSVERTLLDCLRGLPFTEALAVADSAMREGVGRQLLTRVAEAARGPGSPQVRRVAHEASGLAANIFESTLRAHTCDVPGLQVRPQVTITEGTFTVRPDLVDARLRIVCEADSFKWHGGRADLVKDARRYNRLVVAGWIVLRFSYEDVMFDPAYVHEVLAAAVALAELLNEVGHGRRRPA